jgi:hypothetical protein
MITTTKETAMARGKGSINVKLPVKKVIKSLELALVNLEKDWQDQQKKEAKFRKLEKEFNTKVAAIAIRNVLKSDDLHATVRWEKVCVNFTVATNKLELPPEPERDFKTIGDYDYEQQKEEISNAIRILKMTDEETVSTSTYNAISKYL